MTHYPEYAWKYKGTSAVQGIPTLFYQAEGEKPEDTWKRFLDRYPKNLPNKSDYEVVAWEKIKNPEDAADGIPNPNPDSEGSSSNVDEPSQ